MKYEIEVTTSGGRRDIVSEIDVALMLGGVRIRKGEYRIVIERLRKKPLVQKGKMAKLEALLGAHFRLHRDGYQPGGEEFQRLESSIRAELGALGVSTSATDSDLIRFAREQILAEE